MNAVKRRLAGLNLALLMLLSVVTPATAAPQVNLGESTIPFYIPPIISAPAYLSDSGSTGTTDEPFSISVDGNYFSSAEDQSGDGWRYRAANQSIELTNYRGGAIISYGDLTIHTKGTVTITGSDSSYAESGITVSGSLTLFATGSLTVTGGSGAAQAGNAVAASGNIRLYAIDGTVSFLGGSSLSSRTQGGHALRGKQIYLSGKQVNAVGGNGYSTPGGSGIYADTVYLDANGLFQGGTGSVDAAGICFFTTCRFGVINAEIIRGGASAYPISTGDPPGTLSISPHTTLSADTEKYVVSVKLYELLLHGNGGLNSDESTFTTLQNYYPTCYDLQEYLFQQDGYVQMGWTETTENGNWVPLDTLYCPATDTDLYAYWVSAGAGDILLSSLSGTFADSSYYQKYSGTPVALPDALTYPNTSLLAWGSTLTDADNEQYLFPGVWYSGGDTVQPTTDAATVLYGKTTDGTYAIYHPTQGTVAAGGTILLQGTTATSSDLITYTPDASVLTAPEGYQLAGWATDKGNEATYAPGSAITIPSQKVVHLYAVWDEKTVEYTPEPGVSILYTPQDDLLQVVLSDTWCADNNTTQGILGMYRDTGSGLQMLRCITGQYQPGQDLILELDYDGSETVCFSLFTVDDSYAPTGSCISFDTTKFS